MSEAQKAAEAYVKETDYIDDLNRNLAGNAFLAGAAWQRAQDAKPVPEYCGKHGSIKQKKYCSKCTFDDTETKS